jgi:hypothetical protein
MMFVFLFINKSNIEIEPPSRKRAVLYQGWGVAWNLEPETWNLSVLTFTFLTFPFSHFLTFPPSPHAPTAPPGC